MTEDQLYKTKFWDYRIVTPTIATMQFIVAYVTHMREYHERRGDSRHVNVLKSFDMEKPQMWSNWGIAERTRQWCDEQGMTYDEYWRYAAQAHEDLGWAKAFMNVMCGEKMRALVFLRFNEGKKNFLRFSKHPFFSAANYKGCALQKAYYKEVTHAVGMKYRARSVRIIKEMVDDGVIPVAFFMPSVAKEA